VKRVCLLADALEPRCCAPSDSAIINASVVYRDTGLSSDLSLALGEQPDGRQVYQLVLIADALALVYMACDAALFERIRHLYTRFGGPS
jgi:hypothetical protein